MRFCSFVFLEHVLGFKGSVMVEWTANKVEARCSGLPFRHQCAKGWL